MKKCVISLVIMFFGINLLAKSTQLEMQKVINKKLVSDYVPCSSTPIAFSSFSEDFESGATGWYSGHVSDLVKATWHTDTFQAYGGSGKSWWMGGVPSVKGYDDMWYQTLTSPSIILPDTGLTLTFKMDRHVEGIAGAEAPYDGWDGCNVRISIDNGNTWTPLLNPTPAYTCNSMYSFGYAHGEGINVPGWGDSTNGWVDVSFDISSYANDTVMIRWVFASDPAYCTISDGSEQAIPHPELTGLQIDDINVAGVFTNDGEDTTGFTYTSGAHKFVDRWVLTDSSSHSPTHSYNCVQDTGLFNGLASPNISVPDSGKPVMLSYYVWCNMPDCDGDTNNKLDDFYSIDISTDDGVLWNRLAYDYAYNGSDLDWVLRDSGLMAGSQVALDLSQYAGETIKLRWTVITDNNNDGGTGKGLFIDDISMDLIGIEENAKQKVSTYSLSNCLPNPFTRNTEIKYSIPTKSFVIVKIFNLSGQEVSNLVNKEQNPGSYSISWNGKDKDGKLVPTGMYLYQLKSGSFSETKKMVLMK